MRYRVRLEATVLVEAGDKQEAEERAGSELFQAFGGIGAIGGVDETDARSIKVLGTAFPNCPDCGAVLDSWNEICQVAIQYSAYGKEVDRDYARNTSILCPYCSACLAKDIVQQIRAGVGTD